MQPDGSVAVFGFGLQLHSKFAKIFLAEKAAAQLHIPQFDAFLAEHDIVLEPEAPADSFFLCVSIREPSIELRAVGKDLFVGLSADDLSMYETNLEQFDELCAEGFDFNKTTDREARFGANRHRIPFIHRASLHAKLNGGAADKQYEGFKFDAYSTLLGDNKQYGHAFEVRLLLSSRDAPLGLGASSSSSSDAQKAGLAAAEEKSVHFFVDFHDIMLSHDPRSTWLLTVVKILSPQTASQMSEYAAEEYQRQLLSRYKKLSSEQQRLMDIHELLAMYASTGDDLTVSQLLPSGGGAGAKRSPVPLPFEKTVIDVRVRDCLVDYCCLLTLGLLTVASTIVSNSPRFALKFKVSGLALHLSNRLPLAPPGSVYSVVALDVAVGTSERRNAGEQQQLAQDLDLDRFFLAHGFVEFLTVDHMDNSVVVNHSDLEALAIHSTMGTCCMTACVDSLELFAVREPHLIWSHLQLLKL